MGTRLICLCIVAFLRGSAWPGNESEKAAACEEEPEVNRGGSERVSSGSGPPGSTSVPPERDSEWTVWKWASAELAAISLRLAERLSWVSLRPPSLASL